VQFAPAGQAVQLWPRDEMSPPGGLQLGEVPRPARGGRIGDGDRQHDRRLRPGG
jgi:hypothetical protein